MNKGFYLVWNSSTGYTKFRHESRLKAEEEAERLSSIHKGEEFIVLAAVCSRKVDAMQRKQYMYPEDDEIPF